MATSPEHNKGLLLQGSWEQHLSRHSPGREVMEAPVHVKKAVGGGVERHAGAIDEDDAKDHGATLLLLLLLLMSHHRRRRSRSRLLLLCREKGGAVDGL